MNGPGWGKRSVGNVARQAVLVLLVAGCAPPAPRVVALDGPAAGAATDPAVALDPVTGDALLSWLSGDDAGWHIYFARSADGGASWTAPVRVTDREHDVHPHAEASPRLVAAPGALALVWTNSIPVPGRKWPASNIRFSRSIDGGRTWSRGLTLNDDTAAGPAGHTFHGAAWRGDSGLAVAWLDERGGVAPGNTAAEAHGGHHVETPAESDATIYVALSEDLGHTWAPNRPMWGAACPCCRVSLARGPDGAVIAAWRKHFAGNVRDAVVAPLAAPGGETRVHADDWVYPGCPHTGPGVAVDAAGATHVAWYRGNPGAAGVFYARAKHAGAGFRPPVALLHARTLPTGHPRVAALPDGGAVVAWDVGEDGRPALHVAHISPDGRAGPSLTVPGSASADHPEVVSLGDGRAIVAWTERLEETPRVRLASVTP